MNEIKITDLSIKNLNKLKTIIKTMPDVCINLFLNEADIILNDLPESLKNLIRKMIEKNEADKNN